MSDNEYIEAVRGLLKQILSQAASSALNSVEKDRNLPIVKRRQVVGAFRRGLKSLIEEILPRFLEKEGAVLVDTLRECVEESLALLEIQEYLQTHSIEDAAGNILSITLKEMEESPLCRAIKRDAMRGLQKACAKIIKEETAQAVSTDIIAAFLEMFARPKE